MSLVRPEDWVPQGIEELEDRAWKHFGKLTAAYASRPEPGPARLSSLRKKALCRQRNGKSG